MSNITDPSSAIKKSFDDASQSLKTSLSGSATISGSIDANLHDSNGLPYSNSNPLPVSATIDTTAIATQAKQDVGNASLASIDGKLTDTVNGLKVDGSGVTQPVSASALPLPTGASTETTLSALNTKVTTTVNGIKVDGSAVTQPISGTITANAGTNLNTSALALESGGNLATIATRTPALGQTTMSASSPVVIASDQSSLPVKQTVSTSVLSNVSAAATNTALLSSNANRRSFMVFNDSASNLYINFGGIASTSAFTVKLQPYSFFECPLPTYTGAINGIWDSATGTARLTELS